MAQSIVDICNSALQKVGAVSIVSLDDNSREARQCKIAYDSNRRSELRKHPWNFAVKRVVLAPESTSPSFDYAYQFPLPSDCLRVLIPPDACLDWAVEGKKILSNTGPILNLRYISDVEDVTQFDPAFYDMLAISLAIDICEAITTSASKTNVLEGMYKEAVSEARRNNAFERLPMNPPADTLWLARNGGAGDRQISFTFP